MGPRVSWVATPNLHVTFKFLGQVDRARIDAVRAALDRAVAGVPRFEIAVDGLGAFPTVTRPRVIWAGIGRGREPLGDLAGRVERALADQGFAPEDRPFSPHVTLGRVREPRRDARLEAALTEGAQERFGTLAVERVSLMQSELSPRGARHTELSPHLLVI